MRFKSSLRMTLAALVIVTGLAVARAEEAPALPADAARPRMGLFPGNFKEHLSKLDLTEEQLTQINALLESTKQKMLELRAQAAKDDKVDPREKFRTIMGETRARVQEILTPEQQIKLRDLIQASAPESKPEPPKAAEIPKPIERRPAEAKPAEVPPVMKEPGVRTEKKPAPAPAPAAPVASGVIETGQPAPLFSLKTTTDRTISLSSYKGHVVVVVFGSYSTPSFRQRINSLEKLAKDNGLRATFFIVYTREAHAIGDWEVARNRDEDVSVEQPKTEADRKAQAKQAINALKITVPVVLDTMDDATAKAYGLAPNGAVIIGRDGNVAARQRWFEPIGLKQQLDVAVAVKVVKE